MCLPRPVNDILQGHPRKDFLYKLSDQSLLQHVREVLNIEEYLMGNLFSEHPTSVHQYVNVNIGHPLQVNLY